MQSESSINPNFYDRNVSACIKRIDKITVRCKTKKKNKKKKEKKNKIIIKKLSFGVGRLENFIIHSLCSEIVNFILFFSAGRIQKFIRTKLGMDR